jgi:hypothetical protein
MRPRCCVVAWALLALGIVRRAKVACQGMVVTVAASVVVVGSAVAARAT